MKNRNKIAKELMVGCPLDEDERKPFTDHAAIAHAIKNNDTVEDILNMPEMDLWPDTADWVRRQLS